MENVLQFLSRLSENNTREWFSANKNAYDESRKKVLFLTEVLINEIRKFDPSISVMNPADCTFRIFRDVRFSNDKRPYKTNFGCFIARGGRKSGNAGYYLHIEPGAAFAGGGIYMPEAENLKILREYIAENGEEFLSIVNNDDFKKVYPEMYDDKLKTSPKGYAPNHEFIEILKYKSFAFTHPLKDEEILSENFIHDILVYFKQLSTVNSYLNTALQKID
jgi:uncharacterized protein (TIGR02453 family)